MAVVVVVVVDDCVGSTGRSCSRSSSRGPAAPPQGFRGRGGGHGLIARRRGAGRLHQLGQDRRMIMPVVAVVSVVVVSAAAAAAAAAAFPTRQRIERILDRRRWQGCNIAGVAALSIVVVAVAVAAAAAAVRVHERTRSHGGCE